MISRSSDPIGAVLFWAFLALLVWVPIPLGSNRPWAWMVLEVWAYVLAAAWLLAWAVGRVEVSDALRGAWPAWILLGAWLALQALHVVPMPASWVARLSPEAARMHALAGDVGIHAHGDTLSIDPHASLVSLHKSLAYAAVFFLALALVSRRSRMLILARVLVYAAVANAVYAVLLHLGGANGEWFG